MSSLTGYTVVQRRRGCICGNRIEAWRFATSAFSRSGATGSPIQARMALRVRRDRRQCESFARGRCETVPELHKGHCVIPARGVAWESRVSALKRHFTRTPPDAGGVTDATNEVVKLIVVGWVTGFVSLRFDGRRSPPRWERLENGVTAPIGRNGAKGAKVVRGSARCESCDESECQVGQDGLEDPCFRRA